MRFKTINANDACELLKQGKARFVDIRDPQSFQQGRIKGALHLDNNNIGQFIAEEDKSQPLVVCCFHGMSSQSAAQYLVEQGFKEVYSLDGGFELWKGCQPDWCE